MLSASDNACRMYSLFETGDVEFGIDAQKLLADIDIVKSGLIKRTGCNAILLLNHCRETSPTCTFP